MWFEGLDDRFQVSPHTPEDYTADPWAVGAAVLTLHSWKTSYSLWLSQNSTTNSLLLALLMRWTVDQHIFCVIGILYCILTIKIEKIKCFLKTVTSQKNHFQYIYWKNSAYQWTCVIQTWVVLGSTVFFFLL